MADLNRLILTPRRDELPKSLSTWLVDLEVDFEVVVNNAALILMWLGCSWPGCWLFKSTRQVDLEVSDGDGIESAINGRLWPAGESERARVDFCGRISPSPTQIRVSIINFDKNQIPPLKLHFQQFFELITWTENNRGPRKPLEGIKPMTWIWYQNQTIIAEDKRKDNNLS